MKSKLGNPGKRPYADLRVDEADLEPPEYLVGYAREEWDRIVPIYRDMGVINQMDMAIVCAYCMAYAKFRELSIELAKIESRAGNPMSKMFIPKTVRGERKIDVNPVYREHRKAAEEMLKYASECGLTPIARSRLALNIATAGKFGNLVGG